MIFHAALCRAPGGATVLVSALSVWICTAPTGCSQKPQRAVDARLVPVMAADPAENPPQQLYWPGWRGTNTSGISANVDLPAQWSASGAEGWRVEVPGHGNSSPVVCGNHVLLTAAKEDEVGGELWVLSFDRRNGAIRWKTKVGTAVGGTHAKNGHASASVATDGHQVFASFGSAGLFALDLATGTKNWQADLGRLEHQWGTAASPVLVDNLVIQLCDSEDNSSLAAFDQQTGEPVWRTARPSRGSWSTPVVVEATTANGQRRTELIVNGTGADRTGNGLVIAYDPATGRQLWQVRGTTDIVCPSIIVADDLVISTSGRNGPIIAIKPGGDGDVTTSHVAWQHSRGGAYVPTGIVVDGRLYSLADGGVFTCFDAATGKQLWRKRLRGNFSASLVSGDGKIYAASERGEVLVFAVGEKFEPIATSEMQEHMLATPAIAEGEIFLRGEHSLWCIGKQQEIVQAAEPAAAAELPVDDASIEPPPPMVLRATDEVLPATEL